MNLIKPFSLKRTAAIVMVTLGMGVILFGLSAVGIDQYYWLPTVSLSSWFLALILLLIIGGFWWGFVTALSYLINSSREKNNSYN